MVPEIAKKLTIKDRQERGQEPLGRVCLPRTRRSPDRSVISPERLAPRSIPGTPGAGTARQRQPWPVFPAPGRAGLTAFSSGLRYTRQLDDLPGRASAAGLPALRPRGTPAATGSPSPAKSKDGGPAWRASRKTARQMTPRASSAASSRPCVSGTTSICLAAARPLPNSGEETLGRPGSRTAGAWLTSRLLAVRALAARVLPRRRRRGSHRPCGAAAWRAGGVPLGASAPERPACRWCRPRGYGLMLPCLRG
jgi:hypothetical protein